MVKYKAEITFTGGVLKVDVDADMKMKFTQNDVGLEMDEMQRAVNVILQSVYLLSKNSGTEIKVRELV